MISKHPALTALLGWLIPSAAIILMLVWAPNVTTRTADVGSLVSTRPRPHGNFWGDPATIVQTTHGMFVANGIFSAMHGEPLVIRDTSRDGLMVCAKSPLATCAALTGNFVGSFTPVPGARAWLPFWFWVWLEPIAWVWGVLGALWFLIAVAGCSQNDDEG